MPLVQEDAVRRSEVADGDAHAAMPASGRRRRSFPAKARGHGEAPGPNVSQGGGGVVPTWIAGRTTEEGTDARTVVGPSACVAAKEVARSLFHSLSLFHDVTHAHTPLSLESG